MGKVIYLFDCEDEEIKVRPSSFQQPDLYCRGCGQFSYFEAYLEEYHIQVPFCGNREHCWPKVVRQVKEMKKSLQRIKNKLGGQCPKELF